MVLGRWEVTLAEVEEVKIKDGLTIFCVDQQFYWQGLKYRSEVGEMSTRDAKMCGDKKG